MDHTNTIQQLNNLDKLITIQDYNSTGELFFQNKTVIVKQIFQIQNNQDTDPFQNPCSVLQEKDHSQTYFINLQLILPIPFIYASYKNNYIGHEQVSDIVTKTFLVSFAQPIKLYLGNTIEFLGNVYTDNIYFTFKPTPIKWKKWKAQTVQYDSYSHYFVYIDHQYYFTHGGYGSHIDIKAKFKYDSHNNQEYAEIYEIQFYAVKDPLDTLTITQIKQHIYNYHNNTQQLS
jgi:hypothetical protein